MTVDSGVRHVLPIMQKQNYGRIVNAASVGGIRRVLNQTPYVASKHAVAGMTKNVALEYTKSAETEYAEENPTKRLGLPEEVAKVVCFLMSESASYVNGQVIAIDGGQSNLYGNV